MNRIPHSVAITALGRAISQLESVDNDKLSKILADNGEYCRAYWQRAECRQWWYDPSNTSPLRLEVERKFKERYQRAPEKGSLTDWQRMFDDFVCHETETDDKWICDHTGIESRFFAKDGVSTSDLAIEAGRNVLTNSGWGPEDIDGVVLGTVTPDHNMTPPTSAIVADALGITSRRADKTIRPVSFADPQDACCSGIVALQHGFNLVRNGACKRVLVIGADKMSGTTNRFSRRAFPILADGAAAAIIEEPTRAMTREEFFGFLDGSLSPLIITRAGGSRRTTTPGMIENPFDQQHMMYMDGPNVHRFVRELLWPSPAFKGNLAEKLIPAALIGLDYGVRTNADLIAAVNQFGKFVFHQANLRTLEEVQKTMVEMGYLGEFLSNIVEFGNTTSAAILLCLCLAWEDGKIFQSEHVGGTAFGGGGTGVFFSLPVCIRS